MVAGVVAGPATVDCIQRGDFARCMSETFFGGAPAVAETETETQSQPATQDVATLSQAQPEAPEEDEADPVATVEPAFGLVRVEPDGSAVIAGTATPSSEVQLFANDTLLGSETTEATGDFAHVTTEPLPTGGVELRLLDVASGEYATTSIVVVVQDDRESEPLVVASEPGQASEILQRPEAEPEAATGTEPAATETPAATAQTPETLEASAEEPASEETVAVAQAQETGPVTDEPTAVEEAASEQEAPVAAEEAPAIAPAPMVAGEPSAAAGERLEIAQADEPANDDAAPSTAPAAIPEPATEATGEETASENAVVADEAPAAGDGAAATEETVTADEPFVAGEATVGSEPRVEEEPTVAAEEIAAANEPAVEDEPAPIAAIVPPTIDAVEIDGDRNFFAGGGTDGMAVRLYVDNSPVGSTEVRDGRWLIEAIDVLTATAQRIRVDMLNADGSVAGRAEVDFVIDMPEEEPAGEPLAVAEAPQAQPETGTAPQEEPAPAPEAPSASDVSPAPEPAPQPDARVPAPDVAENEQVAVESVPDEGASEETAVEQQAVVEEPAPGPVPTMIGTTDGERTTSGLVIIRRGDNLWTIARRVYGEGLRYTQIYEANASQIRDPDLIYPGQVFDLPDTDMVIGEEE